MALTLIVAIVFNTHITQKSAGLLTVEELQGPHSFSDKQC
jgi:hypothetical protein